MKKIVRTVALLLLPVLLYYSVFLALEPNNYFNLREVTPSGVPIGALRSFENNPQTSLIVGDSRVAHFDMELVEEVAGRPFGNIAYGGASLREELDLLEWWMEKYPQIDEVVFGLSFYTLNAAYEMDRVEGLQQALYNPFVYLTNLSFHLDAMQTLRDYLDGKTLYGGEGETEDPADYVFVEYATPEGETVLLRDRLVNYMEEGLSSRTSRWSPNEIQFERLLKTIEDAAARGVRFVVVLPPMHPCVLEYIVKPNGIYPPMLEMLELLHKSPALVLDYEITGRPDFTDDQFFDGLHLDAERGMEVWTRMLFTDINTASAG